MFFCMRHRCLWLMVCSLRDITASLADVQRTLTSLTNAVASTVPRQSLEGVSAPPVQEQQEKHQHEVSLGSDPSIIPEAPIQVIRNMHSWIT